MREVLPSLGFDFVTRKDLGIDIIVDETGSTYLENALLKARAICEASGMPAIADDSGIAVDALGGAPGLYSSSYGGDLLDDDGRCDYLLKNMENMEQRGAKFVCVIVCVYPDGKVISAQGECSGELTTSRRGANGFGYDPIFIADGMDKTMAQLPPEEKNAISHRGKALREFAKKMVHNI